VRHPHGTCILSEMDRRLIGQVAAMAVRVESLQSAIVEGRSVDGDELIRTSSQYRRLLGVLRARAAAGTKTDATWLDDLEARYADADDDKAEASDAQG
jgi:hypothetical protein